MRCLFIFLLILFLPAILMAQDTISVDLSDETRLSILSASFGFVIKASAEERTMLEAVPLVTIGPRYRILIKDTWGLNSYLLFSTEDENMFPMPAIGPSLKGNNKISGGQEHQVVLGYYMGPVKGDFSHSWIERLRLMLTFKLR